LAKNNKYNTLTIFITNFLLFINLFFGVDYIDRCNYNVDMSGFYIIDTQVGSYQKIRNRYYSFSQKFYKKNTIKFSM